MKIRALLFWCPTFNYNNHYQLSFVTEFVMINTVTNQIPVMSAPSSISPRASASWKLNSWYSVLPLLCSLQQTETAKYIFPYSFFPSAWTTQILLWSLCVCTVYGLKPAKSALYTNEFQGNDDKRHHFTKFMLIKHLPHLFIYLSSRQIFIAPMN